MIPAASSITAEDRAWFETWRASHYDALTRRVVLAGDPPPYVIAHEEAHAAQHAEFTLLFLFWALTIRLPRLHRLAHLLLELDAHRRAQRTLRLQGLDRDPENTRAATLMLRELFNEEQRTKNQQRSSS